MSLHIEKLSEKNLKDVLEVLFPACNVESQKRFLGRTQRFIVDYFIDDVRGKFVFEFDGPTHFTRAKTQLRDLNLVNYCLEHGYSLIRIPYFLQIDDRTIYTLFTSAEINDFDLSQNIKNVICAYASGFHDKEITYPGDFNSKGWSLFWNLYKKMNEDEIMSVMKQIYESLESKNPREVLGVDWEENDEKKIFWEYYPT